MKAKRNITNIARTVGIAEQNLQQFISDSPWSGQALISVLQQDVAAHPHFQEGSMLLIDESANEKAGEASAGAGRQHNGRLGKVELSQVGVFLSLTKSGYHNWIGGELFFPERWFTAEYAASRKRIGLPKEHAFATKLELALQLTKEAEANGVVFEAVDFDSLYGRSGELRDAFQAEGFEYYADIPSNTRVYLSKPQCYYPLTKRGKPSKNFEVSGTPYRVDALPDDAPIEWAQITLRPNERGMLRAKFGRCPVWTVRDDASLRQEWLLIRQAKRKTTYSLSNASAETTLFTMAERKSQRYFIERSHQDAKSELGWDEFQALKYTAWLHHLALTIMANWFVTETRQIV
jgi:SRSO17 transposase